uniref:Uncharacterized protein n=1 Tax=Nelumbo nucifera TaxID=4432 RepID=A0A822Z5V5_NELNU|nr:TPA_asm: hypothetical protein HUJ06_007549 [Nelumbo nucifera]
MEDADAPKERLPSPFLSVEAVEVPGEALQNVYTGNANMPPLPLGQRRSQSGGRGETVSSGYVCSNSFQRWKAQTQKAWRLHGNTREKGKSNFNPEILAEQKRQWYRLHSKTLVCCFGSLVQFGRGTSTNM